MPKGTRVHRCVSKLRKKYKYGKAIGICQKSTKQNYMTGKRIRQKKRKTRKRKARKKRGGAGEPNDGLIYARDFVNVAQEPEDGWANWQWDPNTLPPPLKLPIGSKYLLYTYNGNDDHNPEIDIVELVSNMVSPFNNDGELMIMFANIENDDGWPFESDDWNKEDGGAPTIGTHQDAYDGDIRGDYPMYVIEHFVGKQQRISDLPKKPTPKPPKSHQGWPLKIPEPKSKLPYMTQPETKTAVAAAAGGRKKTRKKYGGYSISETPGERRVRIADNARLVAERERRKRAAEAQRQKQLAEEKQEADEKNMTLEEYRRWKRNKEIERHRMNRQIKIAREKEQRRKEGIKRRLGKAQVVTILSPNPDNKISLGVIDADLTIEEEDRLNPNPRPPIPPPLYRRLLTRLKYLTRRRRRNRINPAPIQNVTGGKKKSRKKRKKKRK